MPLTNRVLERLEEGGGRKIWKFKSISYFSSTLGSTECWTSAEFGDDYEYDYRYYYYFMHIKRISLEGGGDKNV